MHRAVAQTRSTRLTYVDKPQTSSVGCCYQVFSPSGLTPDRVAASLGQRFNEKSCGEPHHSLNVCNVMGRPIT